VKTLVVEGGQAPADRADARRPAGVDQAGAVLVKAIQPCSPSAGTLDTWWAERRPSVPQAVAGVYGTHDPRPAAQHINGGRRGYLVGMASADAQRVLKPTLVSGNEKE
jgi:hypothetical protein